MSSCNLFVCIFVFSSLLHKVTRKASTSVSTPTNRSTTLADLKTKIQQLLRFPAFQCNLPNHKLEMYIINKNMCTYITHHIDSSKTHVSAFHPGGLSVEPFLKLQVLRNGWWKNTASMAENSEADKPSLSRLHCDVRIFWGATHHWAMFGQKSTPSLLLSSFQGVAISFVTHLDGCKREHSNSMPWAPQQKNHLLYLFMANNENRLNRPIFHNLSPVSHFEHLPQFFSGCEANRS